MSKLNSIIENTKLIIFDQYGTIVDMQKGLTEAVTPFLKKKKIGLVTLIDLLHGGEELILKIQ